MCIGAPWLSCDIMWYSQHYYLRLPTHFSLSPLGCKLLSTKCKRVSREAFLQGRSRRQPCSGYLKNLENELDTGVTPLGMECIRLSSTVDNRPNETQFTLNINNKLISLHSGRYIVCSFIKTICWLYLKCILHFVYCGELLYMYTHCMFDTWAEHYF